MLRHAATLVALSLLAPALARGSPGDDEAEVGALPCRPTIACTAEFVPPGQTEVELGYAARRFQGGVQHTTPLLLKLTVLEGLQLQVATSGAVLQLPSTRYLDDLQLLAKLRLAGQGTWTPSLAVSAALSFPTGVGDLGYRPGLDAQGILYVTRDLGPVHGDLNLAVNVLELDRAARAQPWAALAVSLDAGRGLTPMAELYGFSGAGSAASRDAGVLMALGYAVTPWLVVDAGYDVGLGRQERAGTFFAGLTSLGPRAWTPRR